MESDGGYSQGGKLVGSLYTHMLASIESDGGDSQGGKLVYYGPVGGRPQSTPKFGPQRGEGREEASGRFIIYQQPVRTIS